MKWYEKIEWITCDVCETTVSPASSDSVGWLQIETMALGIFADTRNERHLCNECCALFDDFWGE